MTKNLLPIGIGVLIANTPLTHAIPVLNPANGNTYDAFAIGISWSDANAAAILLGGHLATLTSAEENAFIVANFPEAVASGFWLGGTQPPGSTEPDGGWTWVTGEPWFYTNWAPGAEPNDAGGAENSLHFDVFSAGGGTWNDLSDAIFTGFVVEFEGSRVPDAGLTLGLLGLSMAALVAARRRN